MARRETTITLQDRERNLTFKIREMSATQMESWLARSSAFFGGLQKSEEVEGVPVLLHRLDYDGVNALLNELLGCCYYLADGVEVRCTPQNVDDYVEDVRTLFRLQSEALRLNVGFTAPEAARCSGFPANGNTTTH